MLKNILFVPFIAVFVLAYYYSGIVFAATTGAVTATVTLQNISLQVSDGNVSYGTLDANTSKTTVALSESQTITNNGNVTIDVNIISSGTNSWTLAATNGVNTYEHKYCLATCSTYDTNYTAITTGYTQAVNDLAASGTQNLDLGLKTPTSSTFYTQQDVSITLQAVYGL